MSHDEQAIRQRFNRRFAFGLHASISLIISALLFFVVFTHPLNTIIADGQEIWMGYARPDLTYIASMLVGIVGAHGSWLLWREGKFNSRTLRFSLHIISTITYLALVFTFLSSWYFSEVYKWIDTYTPISPNSPPTIIVWLVMLMTALLTMTLPIHALWLLYQTLMARTLEKAKNSGDAKHKREERLSIVEDDGELVEWAEREMKTKRQS